MLEIVTHFLEAQKRGVSAEEIVGGDVPKYCRELGRNLPGVRGGQARVIITAIVWTCIALLDAALMLWYDGSRVWIILATITNSALVLATFGTLIWHLYETMPHKPFTNTMLILLGVLTLIIMVAGIWSGFTLMTSVANSTIISG